MYKYKFFFGTFTYMYHCTKEPFELVFIAKPLKKMPLQVPKTVHLSLNEEQLKRVFKQKDVNSDGVLDKEELKKAFQQLGAVIPVWRVYRALDHVDGNGDGFISDDELEEVVKYSHKVGYSV